jgi:Alpha-glutamyl/putrescinyl thymine pyrophosphorylase clade 3
MRPYDQQLAENLETGLTSFDREKHTLVGIQDSVTREALIEQILESIHRVKYVSVIRTRNLSDRRADPNDEQMFDPLKAAILYQRQGHTDEAFWMVFLFVHFGKHPQGGWRYAREIYGRLGSSTRWDWACTSTDPSGFREWLSIHQNELRRKSVPGGFGNHRKYQSLDAYSLCGTGAAVESYVRWVGPPRTHQDLMGQVRDRTGGDPRQAFDYIYQSMGDVITFGRVARFDYLTMVCKLGLAPIEPGSAYLQNSTGPLKGARLLFEGYKKTQLSAADLDRWLVELDKKLNVGMQVLEDSLCNWQKSPERFLPFRG